MADKIITVKNIEGEADTKAVIIHQNNIIYTPKVSVIIPVYNTENYLRECLDSVINQTLKEIEIICIDDGSTDSSLEILKEYAKKDNRFTIVTQQNLHAGVARNAGLTIAKGEYVYFLDSDDYIEGYAFSKLYNRIIQKRADICLFKCKKIINDKSEVIISSLRLNYIMKFGVFSPKRISKNILQTTCSNIWTKLYSRKYLMQKKLKFQTLKSCNDVYFNILSLLEASKITYLDEYLINYRVSSQGNTTSKRGLYSKNIIIAYSAIIKQLKKQELFNEYKDTLYKAAISNCKYELNLTNNKLEFLSLVKSILPKKLYERKFQHTESLLKDTANHTYSHQTSIIVPVYKKNKIFSIRNIYENGNKIKVIYLLGIKFQKRIKIKEGNNEKYANIAFILDDGFVLPTATAITSLIANKDKETILDIYLVVSNLNEYNIECFKKYNNETVNIHIVKADGSKYTSLHQFDDLMPCCASISALLKFELPLLLNHLDKVLYIDGDVIVNKDLIGLFNTNLNDNYVAAIKDSGRIYFRTECTKNIEDYFNSGVMLLNLRKMRDDNMTVKLIEAKTNSKDNSLMDQNIFNIIFLNKVSFLDIKYNFLYLNLTRSKDKYTIADINKLYNSQYKSIKEIFKKCYILHFSSKDKPWKYKNSLCSRLWLKYYKKSKFYNKNIEIQNLTKSFEDSLCEKTFFEKLFSISQMSSTNNKQYHVINLLGLKFKYRNKAKEKFIKNTLVSLTSYPAKINTVEKTIKSLLKQTLKPEKIILVLAEDNFPNKENDLPENLKCLLSKKFEILWTPKDISLYKKPTPLSKEYPDNIIVTADDDIIYQEDWLEKLYKDYRKNSKMSHCNKTQRMVSDKEKILNHMYFL